MPRNTLIVNEIFHSIQGESSRVGLPCAFVRLTGCPLRCNWCDTEYAFTEGRPMSRTEILERVAAFDCALVEVTGGEPLAQPGTPQLLTDLCDAGYDVLLETAGSHDIASLDPRVIRIVDLKCPGSGEEHNNLWSNLEHLRPDDEIKFVIADRADYEWTQTIIRRYDLSARCAVLVSPVFDSLAPVDLVDWVLRDRLPVRVQVQLHKIVWDPQTRAV